MTREDQSARKIILSPTAKKGGDELTERQKLQAVSLWQEEQLQALSRPATRRQLEMASHLPPNETWNSILHLPVPNYQPDRAVKAAIIAKQEWGKWKKDSTTYWAYRYPMSPAHALHVFLGGPRPPSPEEGKAIVEQFDLRTVLTGRICLSIYLTRRRDEHLTQTGSALISLDEILTIRGVKKSRTARHGAISYTNGFRWEDKQAIIEDLVLLQQCFVQGTCVINVKGEWKELGVDGDQYVRFSLLTERNQRTGVDEKVGVFFTPGNWFNLYEAQNVIYIAEVEREVFKFNTRREAHEILIGLALTERWRDLAKKKDYDRPISMQSLLEASVIPFDKIHAARFIERIENALNELYKRGILGAPPKYLTPIDRTKSRWTGDWLACQLQLIPPGSIIEHYHSALTAFPRTIDATLSQGGKRERKSTEITATDQ
jgi:hypothetical protein